MRIISSGWVTGLTSEPQRAEAVQGDEVRLSKETQSKIEALRYEHNYPFVWASHFTFCVPIKFGFQHKFVSESYRCLLVQSSSSCRFKFFRGVSNTNSPVSPAQPFLLCLFSASMTSSRSARMTPATVSLWKCRRPSITYSCRHLQQLFAANINNILYF